MATFNDPGNRLTMADAAGTHAYTYDPLSQLTAVDEPRGFPIPDAAITYDKVGNRTQVVSTAMTNYTSNTLNQYTAVGSASLSYDLNGNLTSDGTRTLTYDSENRLLTSN